MNYLPYVSWGIITGGTARQRASYFSSWGLIAAALIVSGTRIRVLVGNAWRTVMSVYILVSGAWKNVTAQSISISEHWKTI
jgi:hypothetical protein